MVLQGSLLRATCWSTEKAHKTTLHSSIDAFHIPLLLKMALNPAVGAIASGHSISSMLPDNTVRIKSP